MKKEYDFTNAEKGKFFKKDLELDIPIYLEPKIKKHFENLAKSKNIDLSILINQALEENIRQATKA